MTLNVYLAALRSSAQAWEDTSETIRGARTSLADVDTELLGPRVAPAAEAFIDTWLAQIKNQQSAATDHGQALRDASVLVNQADADAIASSQQLLTWADRNTFPSPALWGGAR